MVALNNIHLTVKMRTLSPLLDDASFHLDYVATGGTPLLADVTALCTNVAGKISTGATSLTQYTSPTISRGVNSGQISAFDATGHLLGGRLGSPVTGVTFTPAAPLGAGNLPEGICVVVTLQAPYGADVEFGPGTRPRARDRGRVYFGPIISAALATEATTNRSYVAAGTRSDITGFFHTLATLTGAGGLIWQMAVWSRKDGLFKPISQLWIDDRPDYQRRRADQGGTRTTVTVP